ncbi:MAG: LysM peptidoglycan-binding domain-containing M23 family metallopeptidase [Pseudomonadota bacterium]
MKTTSKSLLKWTAALGALAVAGCTNVNLPGVGALSGPSGGGAQVISPRPTPDARGVISYPNYQVAVAQSGDTITTMAARLGVDAQDLAQINGLPPEAALRPDELVLLPGGAAGGGPLIEGEEVDVAVIAGDALDRAGGAGTATAAGTAAAGPAPRQHRVARGETIFTIARQYDVSVQTIAQWNGLDETLTVREGQVLLIPVVATAAPGGNAGDVATTPLPGSGSPTPEPPSAVDPQPSDVAGAAAATGAVASSALDSQPTAASDTARLAQPVNGRIIRGYQQGQNEGLDFSAAAGSPVRAADDGTVAAITQDVDQVPIVVVRHSNNLLTVYANVGDVKVQRGDTVSRGQDIATIRDGDASFLHFEVREGFDSVDPLPYLTE